MFCFSLFFFCFFNLLTFGHAAFMSNITRSLSPCGSCEPEKSRLQQLPFELQTRIFLLSQNPALVGTCKSMYTISRSALIRAQFLLYRYGAHDVLGQRSLASLGVARQLPVVDYLLKLRANPRADGDHLLWMALRQQDVNMTILLIDKIQPDTRTLHQWLNGAATFGAIAMVDLLVKRYGASVHHADDAVMALACAENRVDLVRHLMTRYQCDAHAFRDRYLRSACLHGYTELVRLLLPGADVHAFNDAALQNAVHRQHVDIAHLLLDAGANPNANRGGCGLMATEKQNRDLLQLLVDNGADPTAQQSAPLLTAVRAGWLDGVQIMLSRTNTPEAIINAHKGALLAEAMRMDHLLIVDYLLAHGADPNLDSAQRGMHDAIVHGHIAILKRVACVPGAQLPFSIHDYLPKISADMKSVLLEAWPPS
ncbi:ankyrin repeat-containing domain protein [Gongronella butleri]|nr:ankyrin repeat-containing domain protein [Gongronella butleri]